jgi:hypothetical protein
MTTIHEIQQVMFFETPLGMGQALFLIDYGIHINPVFVIVLNETREVKSFESNQIKITKNYTINLVN